MEHGLLGSGENLPPAIERRSVQLDESVRPEQAAYLRRKQIYGVGRSNVKSLQRGRLGRARVALGPAQWTPRSGLGFEFDHFVGYFFFTFVVLSRLAAATCGRGGPRGHGGGAGELAIFYPARSSYFVAALYSAGGVMAAALLAELFIRAQRWFQSKWADGNI